MPLLDIPRSDDARIIFLQRALIASESDKENGHSYLSADTIERIYNFLPSYESALTGLKLHRVSYKNEFHGESKALQKLEIYVRDLWEVLKRRVKRHNEPLEVLTYYQLPVSGLIPGVEKPEDWIEIAHKIILGDTAAQNKGFPAMTNPSVKDIHKIMEAAQKEACETEIKAPDYVEAGQRLETLRLEASELIFDVVHELRLKLRRKDVQTVRRIMNSYGATFSYLRGEPVDMN